MDSNLKTSIWKQFGAAIDSLEDTIQACPDEFWQASLWLTPRVKSEFSQFWYVAYHSLFWLDLYLTGTEEGYLPPPSFLLIEQYDLGPLPERVYTKAELLAFLSDCRRRCYETIDKLTDEMAARHCVFGWGECSFLELLLYSMRHVHGHASQLSMLLGQNIGPQPDYVTRAKD
jgi:hypothetical protein